jgi:cobalt-zinc-cadmium efflux system protein
MADHDHHHGHDHGHSHAPANFDRAFAIGVGLNTALVIAQIFGGIIGNSLALLADAGHNASDVLALLLAWGASSLSRRPPSARRTYGLRKSSVLASLVNAVTLLITVGAIAWEALRRLANPETINTSIVAWTALAGIVINTATALLFMSGRKDDLNVKGAFLHMAADAAVSAGVVVAALAIAFTGWEWLDPLVSLAIVAIITFGTWDLLRESLDLAMDAVPDSVDRTKVEAWLGRLPGVTEVHDLHIWGMSTTETALTAHLVVPGPGPHDALLAHACEELHEHFNIAHATIQIESGDAALACRLAPANVV